jgi:hypothetical protein
MGFYELGNGCDSCDTIAPLNNINMQSTPSYLSQASMMAPFGTQGTANVSQYTHATSSGYPQNGGMGSMGTGSSGSTMGATTMTTTVPTTIIQTIPNVQVQQQKPEKQVTSPGPALVFVPSTNKSSNNNNSEGFTDGMYGSGGMRDKKWIILGLVIFSALASNECCKYFLNKSLQLNDGSPMYYLAYAVVAILVTFAAYTYISKDN